MNQKLLQGTTNKSLNFNYSSTFEAVKNIFVGSES